MLQNDYIIKFLKISFQFWFENVFPVLYCSIFGYHTSFLNEKKRQLIGSCTVPLLEYIVAYGVSFEENWF